MHFLCLFLLKMTASQLLGHPGEVISVLARAFTTAPPPPTLTGRLEQRVQHDQSVSHCKNVLKIESEAS